MWTKSTVHIPQALSPALDHADVACHMLVQCSWQLGNSYSIVRDSVQS